MRDILQEIAEKTRERMEAQKRLLPLAEIKAMAADSNTETDYPFEAVLKKPGISFICEVKKASPSKGVIAENFPYKEIAKKYETAGADALSVLTEPFYFLGSNTYLKEIRRKTALPILRKDFMVDEYMIYEAKVLGADAVLLICSILSDMQLSEYRGLARSLGMTALIETHDEKEVSRAKACGAKVIGVNNRNLRDFTVDLSQSLRLRELVPEETLFISESGIKTPEDVRRLKENGTDAVLIGETLMRSGNVEETLRQLAG